MNWRRHLLQLLKPSSFKVGLLTVFFALGLYFFAGLENYRLVEALNYRIFDEMFRRRGPEAPARHVVIVDIDEKSLKKLGQWPWPRSTIAELLRKLDAAGVKTIGFDVVFAETDRTSPGIYLERYKNFLKPDANLSGVDLNYDDTLGKAVGDTKTVLGYFFQMINDGLKEAGGTPCPQFSLPLNTLPRPVQTTFAEKVTAYRPILNIPPVAKSALSEGFFNAFPDFSGIIRRQPLLIACDGVLYPSLAFEMLREGQQAEASLVMDQKGVVGMKLGAITIPTDEAAQVWMNFYGPEYSFPYLSAVDIMEGKIPAYRLKDKFVLIGTSSWGLRDIRATPYSNTFPGVEVHATVIDNALEKKALFHDILTERALIFCVILVCGTILAALLAFSSPLISALAGAAFIGLLLISDYQFFFLRQQLVGVAYPLLTLMTIFVLVTVFNYFFEGKEKRFIRKAFAFYLSPSVIDQLVKQPGKLTLEGEEKVLTVMFSDIRGFTSISEKLSAKGMSAFLNEYLSAMTDIVMGNKGTVDKFIGDAIMALWGAPLDDADHAANAGRAALQMIATLRELRQGWDARGLPPINIGVGLNTGPMSVGNMGSKSRFDYTVIGDNVNLSSRLEGLNKEYGTNILITEATREAMHGAFLCRQVDRVRVKGKLQPVQIYELMAEMPAPPELQEEAQIFELALADYFKQNFTAAQAALTALKEKTPRPLYDIYLERTREFLQNPPGPDWDGVYTFTHK